MRCKREDITSNLTEKNIIRKYLYYMTINQINQGKFFLNSRKTQTTEIDLGIKENQNIYNK